MTKEKPELGDVYIWGVCDKECVIVRLRGDSEYTLLVSDGSTIFASSDDILKYDYKYLGKSKVDLKCLFELKSDDDDSSTHEELVRMIKSIEKQLDILKRR